MITIKTDEDIASLKVGGQRHAQILREVGNLVVPGVSTVTLNDVATRLIKEGGDKASFLNYKPEGAKRPYPASLCISVNNEIVHGIPNENPKILEEGDVVTLDLGLTHKGLIVDGAKTFGVGKISKEDSRLISATEEALKAGILAARGGNTIGDIGYAIETVAKKYNLAIAEGLAGHGVGYSVHEDPYVPNTGRQGQGPVLKHGMVIAIEPMLVMGKGEIVLDRDGYTFKTKDGKKAAHSEHTVLITEKEAYILTR
jgi:methionyl aminopeptidase